MHKLGLFLVLSYLSFGVLAADCSDLLTGSMKKLRSGESLDFCKELHGKVVLAVNTASKCGFTPQFKGLEALYKKYQPQGLLIVGFPSDDFKQEFDDVKDTAKVCYVNYGVTFPMLEKSRVTGASANPFFAKLAASTHKEPSWNFNKYLINRKGEAIAAFESNTEPEQLEDHIQKLLAE